MCSANAQIGAEVANRLPQFTLSGAYGGTASQFGQMFSTGGPFWNLIGDVSMPLFDGGILTKRHRPNPKHPEKSQHTPSDKPSNHEEREELCSAFSSPWDGCEKSIP